MINVGDFTIQDHRECGRKLKEIRDYLAGLRARLKKSYLPTHFVSTAAGRAYLAVDRLRSEMESIYFAEAGDAYRTEVYHPERTPKKTVQR